MEEFKKDSRGDRKVIICTAFLGPWKEAASDVFEIKECSPVLVKRMLDYIYTGDYADFSGERLHIGARIQRKGRS
ncbi:hypothetical protein E4U61_006484 [Claviceps capensis]|nr:hypothetical protein E4U61_006484 [Claviceps capensis]